jgi:hypothetical protein
MEQKTQQNGARAKILRALADADCGLTTAELAESAGLTASQVRDNAGVAKKAGLLTIEQDEMTRYVTYHIAQKGREWLSAGAYDDAGESQTDVVIAPPTAKSDCRYATCYDGGDLRYSSFDNLYEIINEAVSAGSCVTVFQLVEVGRTETRTVFVPV